MGIKISSIADYLSEVSRLRKLWKVPEDKELWFRAEDVRHSKTRLQPGLYRQERRNKSPKSVNKLLKLENNLYEEFGRCATQLSPNDVMALDNEWDSYFLMQHHGVPTRILDWSDGALIALHFAIKNKRLPATSDSTIYVLQPYWLIDMLDVHTDRLDAKKRWTTYIEKKHSNDMDEDDWDRLYLPEDENDAKDPLRKTPKAPLLWDLHHSTRRIAAQRSRFMIFGTDSTWLQKIEREKDSKLVGLTLPKRAVKKVKLELREAGVTESVIFPDLDGLGRELTQLWEIRR